VHSSYASFCLLCAFVAEVFFWLGKIKNGALVGNLRKLGRGKVWVQSFWFWFGQKFNLIVVKKDVNVRPLHVKKNPSIT